MMCDTKQKILCVCKDRRMQSELTDKTMDESKGTSWQMVDEKKVSTEGITWVFYTKCWNNYNAYKVDFSAK